MGDEAVNDDHKFFNASIMFRISVWVEIHGQWWWWLWWYVLSPTLGLQTALLRGFAMRES